RLWLVDRTEQGARVLHRRGGVTRELEVPGVSGRDVRAFLVSRDGSRLVALVRGDGPGGGDSVWVSRLRHDEAGRVQQATPAIRIDDLDVAPTRIRDLAWRTPTTLALLTPVDDGLFRVRGMNIDGGPGGVSALSITVRSEVQRLVGSPAPSQSLFAIGPQVLVPLVVRTDGPLPLDAGITALFYSG
ncbi:MAG: LpqB family beta-propeller domain-containing protein, partial [Nocardioides sp.]|nr:LpqB family beta-propeller domain-containing protein [Nocardioides sp.]